MESTQMIVSEREKIIEDFKMVIQIIKNAEDMYNQLQVINKKINEEEYKVSQIENKMSALAGFVQIVAIIAAFYCAGFLWGIVWTVVIYIVVDTIDGALNKNKRKEEAKKKEKEFLF